MKVIKRRLFAAFTSLLGCSLSISGCRLLHDCASCSDLVIRLYDLNPKVSQNVVVEFQQVDGSTDPVTCVWTQPSPNHDPVWICHGGNAVDSPGETGSLHTYALSDPNKSWTIQLTGPAGTQTLTRTPKPYDAGGEGWPGTCYCDDYSIPLTGDDLQSVGATLSYSSAAQDAGIDGG